MKKSLIEQIYFNSDNLIQTMGIKKFRIDQIKDWIFNKLTFNINDMSNLSKKDREDINSNYYITEMKIAELLTEDSTGTIKGILETYDKYLIEMVLLNDDERYTLCISSQIGCPVGCKFCATGNIGYKRNLELDEILFQFLYAEKLLEQKGKKISNIVFMGMGEPLLNYENVVKSIEILRDEKGRNLSHRRITISTVGIPDKIRKLSSDGVKVKLFFSLHAGNEIDRKKIIPHTAKLEDIIKSLEAYRDDSEKRVSIEYTMIKEINDNDKNLEDLINIAKRLGNFVNLIEYNPIDKLDYQPSARSRIRYFKSILEKNNIETAIRFRRGQEINGACGQLIWKKNDEKSNCQ